ncbi:MAG: platelet-activating factor acetylhydrolase IB subunit [Planctomycetota bacterium]|jgi:beta-glucosidase
MKRNSAGTCVGALTLLLGMTGCTTVNLHSAVKPVFRSGDWWMQRHESFNQRVAQGDVDLVFIGDSITHGWEDAGKEVWHRYYGDRNAVNLGISGDRTQHVIWRLLRGNINGITPSAAVIMIGTNNSNGTDHSAREIADGITAIVQVLRSELPRTKVLILGIFPRGPTPNPQREKNARASRFASELADGRMIHYMDIGAHFLEADGTLTKEIMPDFLHLSPKGYRFWAIAIEGKLRELLGEDP